MRGMTELRKLKLRSVMGHVKLASYLAISSSPVYSTHKGDTYSGCVAMCRIFSAYRINE